MVKKYYITERVQNISVYRKLINIYSFKTNMKHKIYEKGQALTGQEKGYLGSQAIPDESYVVLWTMPADYC